MARSLIPRGYGQPLGFSNGDRHQTPSPERRGVSRKASTVQSKLTLAKVRGEKRRGLGIELVQTRPGFLGVKSGTIRLNVIDSGLNGSRPLVTITSLNSQLGKPDGADGMAE